MKSGKINNQLAKLLIIATVVSLSCSTTNAKPNFGDEWIPLFNGEDFTGWNVPEAAEGSWSVVDGVIKCDPKSKSKGDRNLWTEDSYDDFILYVEWRLTDAPTFESRPLIGRDGKVLKDDDGNNVSVNFFNADSGIILRGMSKAQVNIWNWPIGSGEIWGYRNDSDLSDEVRAGVTPNVRADNPVGEWNTYIIKLVDDRLTILLNGDLVIEYAKLPDVSESGPFGLQYHGGYDYENERYGTASSLVEYRNIYLKKPD